MAASRPSFIAQTTKDWPLLASQQVNTLSLLVLNSFDLFRLEVVYGIVVGGTEYVISGNRQYDGEYQYASSHE